MALPRKPTSCHHCFRRPSRTPFSAEESDKTDRPIATGPSVPFLSPTRHCATINSGSANMSAKRIAHVSVELYLHGIEVTLGMTRWSCLPNSHQVGVSRLSARILAWVITVQRSPILGTPSPARHLIRICDRDRPSRVLVRRPTARPVQCTMGNTKVLGKHSPFSCHFAAIKRPTTARSTSLTVHSFLPPCVMVMAWF